jgi:cytochrome c oxidase cbb3-type subunit 2
MELFDNHKILFRTAFLFFAGLTVLVAILPALNNQKNFAPLPNAEPLSADAVKGKAIYIANGCVACHTQQVRPLEMDAVWGRPSAPGDYAYVRPTSVWRPYAPAVLGSERTGPDLSNVGARQASDLWQYLHLYNPRSVVSGSVMPAFPWLFDVKAEAADGEPVVPVPKPYAPDTGVVVPNARGRALVAYLLARRQVAIEGYGGAR